MLILTIIHVLAFSRVAAEDSLTVRNAHALVYDSRRGDVLLISGADEQRVLGDLWKWTGVHWECLSRNGIPARTFAAATYDGARDRVVLFGGNRVLFGSDSDSNTFLRDHWEWDGHAWQEFKGETPPARAEAGMTYDRKRKRTVLFGGYRLVRGQMERLDDTWEFDGVTWKRIRVPGPPGRNGTAMAYDDERGTVILFGGSNGLADTWEWDGSTWSQIVRDNIPPRFNATMIYDVTRKVILRFGGWDGSTRTNDTWSLHAGKWSQLSVQGPTPRNHAGMVFDSRRNVTILVGGHDGVNVFGDVWEFNGENWTLVGGHPHKLRIENGH